MCVLIWSMWATTGSEITLVIIAEDRSGVVHPSHTTWGLWWRREEVEDRTSSKRDIRGIYQPAGPSRKESCGISFSLGGPFKETSPGARGQNLWLFTAHCSGGPYWPMGSARELYIHWIIWIKLMWHPNTQISYRLNNWSNGFGTKAAEALKRYIQVDQAEFFDSRQAIADWVKFYITPDGSPPTYPFLWKEWNINDETGKVTKKVCTSYHIWPCVLNDM